jgi:hypothetical protein
MICPNFCYLDAISSTLILKTSAFLFENAGIPKILFASSDYSSSRNWGMWVLRISLARHKGHSTFFRNHCLRHFSWKRYLYVSSEGVITWRILCHIALLGPRVHALLQDPLKVWRPHISRGISRIPSQASTAPFQPRVPCYLHWPLCFHLSWIATRPSCSLKCI